MIQEKSSVNTNRSLTASNPTKPVSGLAWHYDAFHARGLTSVAHGIHWHKVLASSSGLCRALFLFPHIRLVSDIWTDAAETNRQLSSSAKA